MDELALAAASALMTAMAADAWSEARAGAVGFWRRVYPERVPAIESELMDARREIAAAGQAGEAETRRELTAEWRRKFHRITQAHPEVIPALRVLEEEWTGLVPAADRPRAIAVKVEQTAIATRRGTVYQAGRDLHQADPRRATDA